MKTTLFNLKPYLLKFVITVHKIKVIIKSVWD